MTGRPSFAVVGHPNKGKSCIVSTLAHDDSVAIGELPGTTSQCRSYPMKVDGEILYSLVDTPGFQRARAAWEWIRQHETSADRHPEVVRAFLSTHGDTSAFPDECQLLAPIMEGAGILYVVDGSVPYGPEYEAEMEILRWTGQPRLALINPIDRTDHIEAWRQALGQYFSVVRVFNAVTADFHKRVELLRAFGQLLDAWRQPLQRAADTLIADRKRRRDTAARAVTSALAEMLALSVERSIGVDQDVEPEKKTIVVEFQRRIEALEQRVRKTVESIYDHHELERQETALQALEAQELFSEEAWRIFGLTRMQLLGLGALGGAAAGGGDRSVGRWRLVPARYAHRLRPRRGDHFPGRQSAGRRQAAQHHHGAQTIDRRSDQEPELPPRGAGARTDAPCAGRRQIARPARNPGHGGADA